MGMIVEASIASRTPAELATGAADDDARQDEHHAGDTQQMGEIPQAERRAAVRVDVGHQVDGHIKDTRDDHHGEAKLAGRGEAPKLIHPALYRQH
jgi:hypothetical protein